jgi:hypothetical protein
MNKKEEGKWIAELEYIKTNDEDYRLSEIFKYLLQIENN